jgi:hypothetical protein
MDDRTMTFETLAVMAIVNSYGTSSAIDRGWRIPHSDDD